MVCAISIDMLCICAGQWCIYIAHGVTEHVGRYDEFAKLLADSGLCVFGHDHGNNSWNNYLWQLLRNCLQLATAIVMERE